MPELDITAAGAHVYDVTITDDAGAATHHCVSVPEPLLAELGVTAAQEPTLVRASLVYLLEREPAGSILRRFSLADIATYFPDYPTDISHRL
ncbi:MAG TPA: hypothetical protein VLW53_11435 [Candidatus Eisenbacteria bacterium]|nr:hypothetical protein [Candidatus Eisenbacteria bacterium]